MLACVQPPPPLRKKIGEGAPSSIFILEEGQLYTVYWMAKNEKSKDYCKADSEQRVLFFHNNIRAGHTRLLQVYRCYWTYVGITVLYNL